MVREIVDGTAGGTDTAVFSAPLANYTIASVGDHLTVTQVTVPAGLRSDGIDTLRNVEKLQFSDTTVDVAVPTGAPTNVSAVASNGANQTGTATVSWTRFTPAAGQSAITSQEIEVSSNGVVIPSLGQTGLLPGAVSRAVGGLANGTSYTFRVRAVNMFGPGPWSAPSAAVTPIGLPQIVTGVVGTTLATNSVGLAWDPIKDGGSPITSLRIQVNIGATIVRTDIIPVTGTAPTSRTVAGLTAGTVYNFRVAAVNAKGTGTQSVTLATRTIPNAPVIGTATAGAAGGTRTASITWTHPAATATVPITTWKITARHLTGGVPDTTGAGVVSFTAASGNRTATLTFPTTAPAGQYVFEVVCNNTGGTPVSGGDSAASARSNAVTPQ
jgi:hypothetical protein